MSYQDYSQERLEAALRVNNKLFDKVYKKLIDVFDEIEDLEYEQTEQRNELEERKGDAYLTNFMDSLPLLKNTKEVFDRNLV